MPSSSLLWFLKKLLDRYLLRVSHKVIGVIVAIYKSFSNQDLVIIMVIESINYHQSSSLISASASSSNPLIFEIIIKYLLRVLESQPLQIKTGQKQLLVETSNIYIYILEV